MDPRAVRPPSRALLAAVAAATLLVAAAGRAAQAQPGNPTEAYSRVAVWTSSPVPPSAEALRDPGGLAVDPFDGRVFVADTGNDRVQVFEANGDFSGSIGGAAAPSALDSPLDVVVQGSVVFVTDNGHDRVALFTVDGMYVGEWTGLAGPWGIAAAPDGRVAVVENGAGRVAMFRADGQRLATWALGSTSLRGADFTPAGRLALVDAGSAVVRVLDTNGDEVRASQTLSSAPLDVAASSDGYLYLTLEDTALVRLQDGLDLPEVRRWLHPGAWGVATAPDVVYTTFRDDARPLHGVQKWEGVPLQATSLWGDVPAPLGVLDDPTRLDADQIAVVFDSWRRVQRFEPTGRIIDQMPTGTINDVASAPDGGVFLAADASVRRLDASGVQVWSWPVPPAVGEYAWVVALAYDSSTGQLAALDIGRQRLWLLDGAGRVVDGLSFRPGAGIVSALWDIAPAPGGWYTINRRADTLELRDRTGRQVLSSWSVPGGALRVSSDSAGDAYVLNRAGWAWKLAPDGTLRAVWRVGDPSSQTSRPYDISVDASDRVLVLDRGLERIEVYETDPSGEPGTVPSFDPTCSSEGNKTADPTRLALGDETQITLEVRGDCPSLTRDVDVVLVIDVSGSMTAPAVGFAGSKMEAAQAAAISFLSRLDFGQFRVAVVAFNQQAQLVAPLSELLSSSRGAISSLVAAGGTDIAAGIDAGRAELGGPRRRLNASAVLILLTDGYSDPLTAQRAADQAKLEGVRLISIGFGDMPATDLLRAIASTQSDFYLAPTSPELDAIYQAIAERISAQVLYTTLTVVDELPANMHYVLGSGIPEPDVTTRTLTWSLADVPMSGTSLTYRVRPLETGRWPTNRFAFGEGTDGLGHPGRIEFPVPEVVVEAPTPTTTVTPPPGPSATPAPTQQPEPIYLPALRNERCLRRRQHADVVLVVDTSGSMQDWTAAGRSKLDAARAAADTFLDLLALDPVDTGQDRAAIVWFNGAAEIGAPIGADRARLAEALVALPIGSGTRIDLGLTRAAEALAARPPSSNVPVVILLTDGIPTETTPEAVIAAADALRATGAVIYAIGLGSDVDRALLSAVTGQEGRVVLAPDGEDLAEIYATIASELPCIAQ